MPKLFKTTFAGLNAIAQEIYHLESRLGSGFTFTLIINRKSHSEIISQLINDFRDYSKTDELGNTELVIAGYRCSCIVVNNEDLPTDFLIAVEEKSETS